MDAIGKYEKKREGRNIENRVNYEKIGWNRVKAVFK
jgi:hypothetical protein